MRIFFFIAFSLFFAGISTPAHALTRADVAGTYRCWSFNSGGLGGTCTSPPLVLNKDGSYSMSSEKGRYTLVGKTIKLSKSTFRGAGTFVDGVKIRFSYTYKKTAQTITYLRQSTPAKKVVPTAQPPKTVGVDLTLRYSTDDGSLSWINTVTLIPKGSTPETTTIKYDALAIQSGKSLTASYRSDPGVKTGNIYTIYTGSGREMKSVGEVDLRTARGDIRSIIDILVVEAGQAPVQNSQQEINITSETPNTISIPQSCTPNIPRYAGGCDI